MKNKQKNKNSFLFFFGSYFAANVCEMINNIHRKTKTKKKKIKKIKTKRKKIKQMYTAPITLTAAAAKKFVQQKWTGKKK